MVTNFLRVSQSACWLTYLQKLGKYRDISCSGWDIFQKFFGDIPRMFLHYFEIITHFLYVHQSISFVTFLLKLCKYEDNSWSGWDIFLIFYEDIPLVLVHYFKISSAQLKTAQRSSAFNLDLILLSKDSTHLSFDWAQI